MCIAFMLLITMLFGCFLSGCSKNNYVGTYKSVFIDAQDKTRSFSFTLTIEKDNTFTLIRQTNNAQKTFTGNYKSYTESNQQQLLCIINEGYTLNTSNPNGWNPYFSLCLLDDGTLMATPGTTSTSSSVFTAFGKADGALITLVLFEKE